MKRGFPIDHVISIAKVNVNGYQACCGCSWLGPLRLQLRDAQEDAGYHEAESAECTCTPGHWCAHCILLWGRWTAVHAAEEILKGVSR